MTGVNQPCETTPATGTVGTLPDRRIFRGEPRRPALVAFVALAIGAGLDRWLPFDLEVWFSAAAATFWLAAEAQLSTSGTRWTTYSVLLMVMVCGGLWHHREWAVRAPENISRLVQAGPQLVKVRGVALESPRRNAADHTPGTPPWLHLDRSRLLIEMQSNWLSTEWVPVSGRVQLDVDGHLLDVVAGDELLVIGRLYLPAPPRNPGSVGLQEILQRQRIDALLRASHPLAVTRLPATDRTISAGLVWSWQQRRDIARDWCGKLFEQRLSPEVRGIARSLLLGDRGDLSEEQSRAFAESGSMHLLAISGLHIGILIGLAWWCTRLLGTAPGWTPWLLMAVALGYAFLAESRPPVLRAVLLAGLFLTAESRRVGTDGLNTLAVSAILLFSWHPGDLFDLGAQLSFLAVWGILMASRWGLPALTPLEQTISASTRWGQFQLWMRTWLWGILVPTAAIWLATVPLAMSRFHLIAPIGLLLNLLLVPFSVLLLASGFLFLGLSVIWPTAGDWWAMPFDGALRVLLAVVRWSSQTPGGHLYLADTPVWWLTGWYLCLGWWWGLFSPVQWRGWGWRTLLCWTLLGLCWPLWTVPRKDLRVTFLSVDHGNAVLLELPDGGTLLYDGGTFGRGSTAARTIRQALWSRGIQRLDAILISHADVDHFNGIPLLLEQVPVGSILLAHSFLDERQPAVIELCEAAARRGVPLRLLVKGDRLQYRPAHVAFSAASLELEVLHPPPGWNMPDDNANSVVLELNWGKRRVLLTGDVEGPGLAALMETVRGSCDILLAPHHGARSANPRHLYEWTKPELVVISAGDPTVRNRIEQVVQNSETRVLSTAESGAITISISATGNITVSEHLAPMQSATQGDGAFPSSAE